MASNCFPFLNTGQMFAVFYMAGVVPDSHDILNMTVSIGAMNGASSLEKENILNNQFQNAFSQKTNTSKEELSNRCKMQGTTPEINDINIIVSGVEKLLSKLNPTKAAGILMGYLSTI
jgi:hypothetical protein